MAVLEVSEASQRQQWFHWCISRENVFELLILKKLIHWYKTNFLHIETIQTIVVLTYKNDHGLSFFITDAILILTGPSMSMIQMMRKHASITENNRIITKYSKHSLVVRSQPSLLERQTSNLPIPQSFLSILWPKKAFAHISRVRDHIVAQSIDDTSHSSFNICLKSKNILRHLVDLENELIEPHIFLRLQSVVNIHYLIACMSTRNKTYLI